MYKAKCENSIRCLNDINQEYIYVNNKHDKIFRKILSDKSQATYIINKLMCEEDKVEIEKIENFNSSFVSDKLSNLEADIVYKIKDKNVFFLIEHQSYIDNLMSYRISKYEAEIMENALNRSGYASDICTYPVVIPIVLYTGKTKWREKMKENQEQLKWSKYQSREYSKYNLIDVNEISDEEL